LSFGLFDFDGWHTKEDDDMGHLEERDLRSLERPSMHSIFAPLDGGEPISRELSQEDSACPTRAGELAVWGFLRRPRRHRKIQGEDWIPAMFAFVRRFG